MASFVVNKYDIGDVVRCLGTFTDADGAVVDPSALTFKFKTPASSSVTTYTYGVDGQLLKTSTGVYYVDITPSVAGIYYYRFAATGSGASAAEHAFEVRRSEFV